MSKLDKYLKEIKERCDAATEGPWGYENRVGYGDIIDEEGVGIANEVLDTDARFITHARQDVESLSKMVRILDYYYKPEETRPGLFDELESLLPGEVE